MDEISVIAVDALEADLYNWQWGVLSFTIWLNSFSLFEAFSSMWFTVADRPWWCQGGLIILEIHTNH